MTDTVILTRQLDGFQTRTTPLTELLLSGGAEDP